MNIFILAITVLILTKFLPDNFLGSFGINRNLIICAIFVIYFIIFKFLQKVSCEKPIENFNTANSPTQAPRPTPKPLSQREKDQRDENQRLRERSRNIEKQRDIALANTFEMQKIKTELSKTKNELEQIKKIKGDALNTKKYYNVLKKELLSKGILDHYDVQSHKIENENSIQLLINKMEKLKKLAKEKDMTNKKIEGTPCSKKWDESQQFNYLHSDNWALPQKREPICHKGDCKTCALDDGLDGFPVGKPPY